MQDRNQNATRTPRASAYTTFQELTDGDEFAALGGDWVVENLERDHAGRVTHVVAGHATESHNWAEFTADPAALTVGAEVHDADHEACPDMNPHGVTELTTNADLVTDGGEEIRDSNEVRHSDDEVRRYSADGHLYAYRDGGEHVVVSKGRDIPDQWTKRVPAERDEVEAGDHLWTIPDNWEYRLNIDGAGLSRYQIHHIPETGVDVLVSEPHKNHLVDAWYGVQRVGTLSVTYADEIDWSELESLIEAVRDISDVSDDVVDGLETLYANRETFEEKFAEAVGVYGEEALFERAHAPVSINGWTVEPWGDTFDPSYELEGVLDVDRDTLRGVRRELSEARIIPSYPTVRVDVDES